VPAHSRRLRPRLCDVNLDVRHHGVGQREGRRAHWLEGLMPSRALGTRMCHVATGDVHLVALL